jgi:hypothetical protein
MSQKRSLMLQCVIGGLTGVDAEGHDAFLGIDSTAVLPMLWPMIVSHDFGHAVGGWLVGFCICSRRVRCLWAG